MVFPHFKGTLTLLVKTLTLLKKVSKVVHFVDLFFFVSAACTAILSSNWKNNSNTLTVSKIQTKRKLNNPTTTSFAGLFLIVVRFNLLE